MYAKEHNPPHFHFLYGEYNGVMYIKEGIVDGKAPVKIINKITEWMRIHKDELLKIWELALSGKSLPRIEPLK
jgi:hypothetical protein